MSAPSLQPARLAENCRNGTVTIVDAIGAIVSSSVAALHHPLIEEYERRRLPAGRSRDPLHRGPQPGGRLRDLPPARPRVTAPHRGSRSHCDCTAWPRRASVTLLGLGRGRVELTARRTSDLVARRARHGPRDAARTQPVCGGPLRPDQRGHLTACRQPVRALHRGDLGGLRPDPTGHPNGIPSAIGYGFGDRVSATTRFRCTMSRCFTPTHSETCWPLRCRERDVALNGNSSTALPVDLIEPKCSTLARSHCTPVRHARCSPSAATGSTRCPPGIARTASSLARS